MQRQNTSSEIIETEVDELFEVKTYFYIGAYQQCLNEINKLRVSTATMRLFKHKIPDNSIVTRFLILVYRAVTM